MPVRLPLRTCNKYERSADIEGSTKRWEHRPQAMAPALRAHDLIIRAAIEEHGGVVFKTICDALCAELTEPDAALTAAVAAQGALAVEPWGEVGPLRVRVALHTGSLSTAMVLYVAEVIIARDPDRVDEFIAPDAVDHAAPSGALQGPAATRIIYRMFFATTTHLGAFMGRPPTGKQVSVPCFETPGIANGKFVEHAGGIDVGGLKSQLGVPPVGVALGA